MSIEVFAGCMLILFIVFVMVVFWVIRVFKEERNRANILCSVILGMFILISSYIISNAIRM